MGRRPLAKPACRVWAKSFPMSQPVVPKPSQPANQAEPAQLPPLSPLTFRALFFFFFL